MTTIILFALVFVLLIIGLPIGLSLGFSVLIAMLFRTNLEPIMIAQTAFTALDSFTLMAIPFFMLAGNFMRYGGISKRLLKFADTLVGFATGGLGAVTVVTCMFFAAISGSGPATVSAIGSFMMPAMTDKGYDKAYSAALTAAAGTIGVIIPPSIPFVVYGVVSGTSIGELFKAGIFPGILMGVALLIVNYRTAKKHGYIGYGDRPTLKTVWIAFKEAFWALLSPVIVLGGIYAGVFTPTEAAAVSCVYSFIIGKFVYHEIGKQEFIDCLDDTVLISGSTSFIIGLSMAFAYFLTLEQIPTTIATWMLSLSDNKYLIFLLINAFLLVVGCFVDNISSCTILTPIFLPIIVALGMSPVQFGIVMTMNLAIGFVTPPYGANLFVASAVSKTPVESIASKVWPLIGALIVVLMLTTFVPQITMSFL
jgi:C4-dicarboxylate transporter DctM subunit